MVLVILAIVASISVPALIGWIDRARANEGLSSAESCLTVVQTSLTEQYAKRAHSLEIGGIEDENLIIEKNQEKYPTQEEM